MLRVSICWFSASKVLECFAFKGFLLVLASCEPGQALLVGRTTPPEAQGPMKVPKGKGLVVEFKNPFETAIEYTAQVCFS